MIYFELFIRFFIIGACSFGGGYAAMPMIQSQIVNSAGWMTASQFADLVSVSEMTPGPIILNTATFTGEQMAGIPGAVVATMGSVLPSVCIVSLIAVFYFRSRNTESIQTTLFFARAAVCALILSAAMSLLRVGLVTDSWIMDATHLPFDPWAVAMTLVCLAIMRKAKGSPVAVIIVSALSGLIVYAIVPSLI